jgi:tetratricopeptide (TPR) repeat protein
MSSASHEELKRALQSPGDLRLILVTAPSGAGRTLTLKSVVAEAKPPAAYAELSTVGDFSGAGVEALVRASAGLHARESAATTLSTLADPVARELLAFAFGEPDGATHTAFLEPNARWEGALAEAMRFLTRSASSAPILLALDDIDHADSETWQLLQLLTLSQPTPLQGAIVLSVCDARRTEVEPRLAKLVPPDRLIRIALAASPSTHEDLSESAGAMRSLLSHLGGRSPRALLEEASRDGIDELIAKRFARSVETRRFPQTSEIVLREVAAQSPFPERFTSRLPAMSAWVENALLDIGLLPFRRKNLGTLLVQIAAARRDSTTESLGHELLSREPGGLEALRKAEALAVGVRRMVLARRIADEELFRGEVEHALSTARRALGISRIGSTNYPAWLPALFMGVEDELDHWAALGDDEALLSVEITRADALAQLGRTGETTATFEGIEPKLRRLRGGTRAALWIRWARIWSWFRTDILGDLAGARKALDLVYEQVPESNLTSSSHSASFLRAEEIISSRCGEVERARTLARRMVELSEVRKDPREGALAQNALGLLFLRDGELTQAASGLTRAVELARQIGFKRREAVSAHNLGLVLCHLGESAAAIPLHERCRALCEETGNLLGRAYSPSALALALLETQPAKAEALLLSSRSVAEENRWPILVAWSRSLSGQLKLRRHADSGDPLLLTQARYDLQICLDRLSDAKVRWSEECDPAEVSVLLALTYVLNGQLDQGGKVLADAQTFAQESAVSRAWIDALTSVARGRWPTEALTWFESKKHRRALRFWTTHGARLKRYLARPPTPTATPVK